MAQGIDVSRFQGTIDWNAVATQKKFAVARATIGMSTKDATFAANYKGMVAAGLIPGAYHLITSTSTGAQQAANLKSTLDAVNFDKGLLVIDVEGWSETNGYPAATTLAVVEYLCNWIRDNYNRTPIIYTGNFWRDTLAQHPNNFGSELWLAAYVTDPTIYIPKAWSTWKIWQYSSAGTVAGITGNVDLDKSAGTLNSLKALAGWEWDELATEDEIRAIVSDEVTKGVSALTLSNTENTNKVITALNAAHDSLADDIANLPATLTKDELLAKFTEVLNAVDEGNSLDEIAAVSNLVTNLHSHVCKRVDLHT